MKTLEEIALQVADSIQFSTTKPFTCDQIEEFARRLVAALGAQEPVGKVVSWSPLHGIFNVSQRHETNSFPDPLKYGVVYAAPVVKEGWQMVPKEPTPEMVEAGRWEDGVNTARKVWQYMLAAAPEYKP